LNHLDASTKSAFIFNSTLPDMQLFQMILEDFGLSVEKKTKTSMLRQFNNFLLEELSKNNNVVLIIDEAQNLKNSVLEELRILSNLETEREKLFQMILVGQPQLRDKINSPGLEQLKQRISVRFHITPLESDEVVQYIYHRLKVAGSSGDITFSEAALDAIYKYSNGIPRIINKVCDKALLCAYVTETRHIDLSNVEKCIQEIEGMVVTV